VRIARHDGGRYLAGSNAAEQALRHGEDLNAFLTCSGPATPATYMVALLRTHGAPPPGVTAPPASGSVAQG
jgi:hypothetical protein